MRVVAFGRACGATSTTPQALEQHQTAKLLRSICKSRILNEYTSSGEKVEILYEHILNTLNNTSQIQAEYLKRNSHFHSQNHQEILQMCLPNPSEIAPKSIPNPPKYHPGTPSGHLLLNSALILDFLRSFGSHCGGQWAPLGLLNSKKLNKFAYKHA